MRPVCIAAVFGVMALARPVSALRLATDDGLALSFAEDTGAVTAVSAGEAVVPLLAPAWVPLSIRIGSRLPPGGIIGFDFNAPGGPWASAYNSAWDGSGAYVTWVPDDGPDGSGHLLLGNGTASGVGMAMAAPVAVSGGGSLRISWRARVADLATTQILCVRLYDAAGNDITPTTPAPAGWGWTSTSQAHAVWDIRCGAAGTWQDFDRLYAMPAEAAALRVSLRHWTGGDHWVRIDDLHIERRGGIAWNEPATVAGPLVPLADGFVQSVDSAGVGLRATTTVSVRPDHLAVRIELQDTSGAGEDRPLLLSWALPVACDGWRWWDDIDVSRTIVAGASLANTFNLAARAVSWYPFAAIDGGGAALALGVPMSEPLVQRFDASGVAGLRSTWELVLSPLTTKIGSGRAAVSLRLFRHDAAWGFRSAADKYQRLFPEDFAKRTTREGAWMYPIHPSQIPQPEDFGFAYHETNPIDSSERAACDAHGIGVFYYVEPWLCWQAYGTSPDKPPHEERMAKMQAWAAGEGGYLAWQSSGGIGDSGHLLLGDGVTLGAGMSTAAPFPVPAGQTVRIAWQAKVADVATNQILCVRVYDAGGADITATTSASGWFWSNTSLAHTIAGIVNTAADAWQPFAIAYPVPAQAAAMRVSLRHWNTGDHRVRIDDLRITDMGDTMPYWQSDFNADGGPWISALNSDWDGGGPVWLRAPRHEAAQAVLSSSPLDRDGRSFIDLSSYFWHEWSPGTWNQAWPVNPDPDLPAPNTFTIHRNLWVLRELDANDGVYIDSVTTGVGLGEWENRRAEHLAVSDSPLAFSWTDGGAAQLAPQAHAEFLNAIAAEVRGLGKLMMLNLFPTASRFHARNADVMGSEVFDLVESDSLSRVRRTFAGRRIVSNLLQWGWGSPTYATYEQMEQFLRGQLFWGFYPAVSSAGGPMTGGAPDRYFLHPELYERDRPLFRRYMPLIRELSTAGWEPVTHAVVSAGGEVERFGDFRRGSVLLTVRGSARSPLEGTVALDLPECGAAVLLAATDVLNAKPLSVAVSGEPPQVSFPVSLTAGEVGVYRFVARALVPADVDRDGDVDGADYGFVAACFNGTGNSVTRDCLHADLNGDAHVDGADYGLLSACFNGSGNAPACP